jgi:hypothetical protein
MSMTTDKKLSNQNLPQQNENLPKSNIDEPKTSIESKYPLKKTEFNEETQKFMMQTLGKMLSLNSDSLQLNTDYLEKNKRLIELREKVENYEIENKNLFRSHQEKEIDYLDKIKNLEKQLLSSDKSDILVLQKQNKDYETQIKTLNKTIQTLTGKHQDENLRFKSMIGDLMMVKDQLESEIKAMEALRKEISEKKTKKNVESNTKQYEKVEKVELKLKYNNMVKKEGFNRYQVRKSTRSEFEK